MALIQTLTYGTCRTKSRWELFCPICQTPVLAGTDSRDDTRVTLCEHAVIVERATGECFASTLGKALCAGLIRHLLARPEPSLSRVMDTLPAVEGAVIIRAVNGEEDVGRVLFMDNPEAIVRQALDTEQTAAQFPEDDPIRHLSLAVKDVRRSWRFFCPVCHAAVLTPAHNELEITPCEHTVIAATQGRVVHATPLGERLLAGTVPGTVARAAIRKGHIARSPNVVMEHLFARPGSLHVTIMQDKLRHSLVIVSDPKRYARELDDKQERLRGLNFVAGTAGTYCRGIDPEARGFVWRLGELDCLLVSNDVAGPCGNPSYTALTLDGEKPAFLLEKVTRLLSVPESGGAVCAVVGFRIIQKSA